MSEPLVRFEMIGDDDAAVCVDGVCAVPEVGTDSASADKPTRGGFAGRAGV